MKYVNLRQYGIYLISITFFLASCSTQKGRVTYWVNSYKTPCSAGAGKMMCLNISKSKSLENAKWENFYSPIEDFNYEPGYFQQIVIEGTTIPKNQVPADGSSIKYRLIEVKSKEFDNRYFLNDTWSAVRINGAKINRKDPIPNLEINFSEMRVSGSDGCNNYTGKINSITNKEISFGPIAGTKKMCINMETPNAFNGAINKVSTYLFEDKILRFYDKAGGEVLAFIKTD